MLAPIRPSPTTPICILLSPQLGPRTKSLRLYSSATRQHRLAAHLPKTCLRYRQCCGADKANTSVMPGLVPGIQLYTCSGARFAVDPGNKCRDDMEPSVRVALLAISHFHRALADHRCYPARAEAGGAGNGRQRQLRRVSA